MMPKKDRKIELKEYTYIVFIIFVEVQSGRNFRFYSLTGFWIASSINLVMVISGFLINGSSKSIERSAGLVAAICMAISFCQSSKNFIFSYEICLTV